MDSPVPSARPASKVSTRSMTELEISFLSNPKDSKLFISWAIKKIFLAFSSGLSSLNSLNKTKAKACLIDKKNSENLPKYTSAIIVENPYKAFALISNLFNQKNVSSGIIADLINISKTSKLGNNIQIAGGSGVIKDIPDNQPLMFFTADHLIEKMSIFNKAINKNKLNLKLNYRDKYFSGR